MQGWQAALVAVAIAVPALFALMIAIGGTQLSRLVWQPVTSRRVAREEMPEAVRTRLDSQRARLEGLGFEYAFSEACDNPVVLPDRRQLYSDVYRSSDSRTWAIVAPHAQPTPARPCVLHWISLLPQGRTMMTMNAHRHAIVEPPVGWTLFDDYLLSDEGALSRHVERAAQAGALPVNDADEVFRRMEAMSASVLPSLQASGKVKGTEQPRLRWSSAVAMAWQIYRGQWRAGRSAAPAASSATTPAAAAAGADADLLAYQQQRALAASRPWSSAGKWKAFVITALLFLAVGALWSSWRFATILLAVVALHEGGHYLAMRWTGYRNLSVFFLPGLGGLATGEKPTATPLEKTLVFLAGPLPGLVLATAGLFTVGSGAVGGLPGWFTEFLLACAVVNYLNLLPLVPLDGGRVVETLLFARWPLLRFAFAVFGFAALAVAGVALGDVVLLVLATFLAFGLVHQWRVTRLARALARRPDEALDETAASQRLAAALREPAFARWTFAVRSAAFRGALPDLLGRLPRAWESAAGLAVYTACLLGPLLALHLAAPQIGHVLTARWFDQQGLVPDDVAPDPPGAADEASRRAWRPLEERLAALDALPLDQRVRTLLEAAEDAEMRRDEASLRTYLAQAERLVEPLPPDAEARARVRLAQAQFESDPARSRALTGDVVAALAGTTDAGRRRLLARAHDQLAWSTTDPAERLASLRNALAAGAGTDADEASTQIQRRRSIARTLGTLGRHEEARVELRAAMQSLGMPDVADRSRAALWRRAEQVSLQADMAWSFSGGGPVERAAVEADRALSMLPEKVTMSWQAAQREASEAQLWALLLAGDTARLAPAWARHEKALRASLAPQAKPVLLEIDRWLVGQTLGDAAMQAQARDALSARGAYPPGLCLSEPVVWREAQHERRRAVARQMGLCVQRP